MELISVIVPTYNRFTYLLEAISSIQKQTYPSIEIIVVNDGSTQPEYYEYDWKDVKIINLQENSKKTFGYASPGYVRNVGIEHSKGNYIAFCDDDDIWFPHKLDIQMKDIKKTGCKFSCTDGYSGYGRFNVDSKYLKYNEEFHYETIQNIFKQRQNHSIENGFPLIWDRQLLATHNCVITSSVLIERGLIYQINGFRNMKPPGEDYDCWLRAFEHTNAVYNKTVCFYYNNLHGDGQNY